uniref:Uncharacterized protein n=1 Tax=Anguilla anguilla TaxID=7936 RepID=A0A0E9V495_ANGAN
MHYFFIDKHLKINPSEMYYLEVLHHTNQFNDQHNASYYD